jgi:PAS domain S-box-containing protein
MINRATSPVELAGGGAEAKPSAARRAFMAAAFILVLGLSASTWMYYQGTRSFGKLAVPTGANAGANGWGANSVLLHHFDRWFLGVVVATGIGGVGCLAVTFVALALWRRGWQRRLEATEEQWGRKAAGLQFQLTDSRQTQEQLQKAQTLAREQLTTLEHAHSKLQAEMDQRRRAEQNLSKQRQVLESSKTVLELHVQERTGELQKLQRRYELILNSAGEGICGLDQTGKATFVNPAVATLTGRPIEELIGKTPQEIFGCNGTNGSSTVAEQNAGEQVFHRKDGTGFLAEFVKTSILEDGKAVGTVLVVKDITERKRVEDAMSQKAAELARSNAELEQFAFVASHDLQEPLRKIQAFGDRLKTKCQGAIAADAQDYLERMQSAAARMGTLIKDLLAFSRAIRSGEPFAPVDLAVVTKEVLGDLEVRIEKSGARVEVDKLPTIEADALQMRQLLLNLVGNALKFQPPGAQPVVKVHSRVFQALTGEELCELTIQDNGIGFEEKYLEKIFAVFQRLHGRNEYEGTGIGLAVCRRITDRHHGTITARSQPGLGATFVVTLPVRQGAAGVLERGSAGVVEPAPPSRSTTPSLHHSIIPAGRRPDDSATGPGLGEGPSVKVAAAPADAQTQRTLAV